MNPFDNNYFIGYINYVSPQFCKVHFPSSVLLNKFILSGEEFNGGLIGSFVTIEGENRGFIGKISELNLPEKERLALSEKAFQSSDFHPTAKIEVLLSFDYYDYENAQRNLNAFPNIGAKVYVCASKFIEQYVINFGNNISENTPMINLGTLTSNYQTKVNVSQQSLFARHCAVVGTTGGGKSWTVSKLIEGMVGNKSKVILIDPTGEYKSLAETSFSTSTTLGKESYYYYKDLTIEDLFFLVKPAERIQAPKLLEAIRSLKCIECNIGSISEEYKKATETGVLVKTGLSKREFDKFCYQHTEDIDDGKLSFDIEKLEKQITNECIFDSDIRNTSNFGGRNENDVSNCVSLITRVSGLRRTGIFQSLFGFGKEFDEQNNLKTIIDNFISDKNTEKFLLRIGFEGIGFESQGREIAANAIAKYLLELSRKKRFVNSPIVLMLDEAHQFLNKNVVDQYFYSNSLSSFDQIAKECRKYGLFLCIATQMPKDIPVGTLSQMGTFIVHRLINSNDKESIRQACSSANSDSLAFLPSLGSGEAIITGVDFPMSLSIKVSPPLITPDSNTPQFSKVN